MLEKGRSSEVSFNSNFEKNTNIWASTFSGNCPKTHHYLHRYLKHHIENEHIPDIKCTPQSWAWDVTFMGFATGGSDWGLAGSRWRGISSPANFWNMLNAWNGLNSWGSAQMWMWSLLGWGIGGGGLNDWKNWVSTTLALCWSYQQYQYWTMVDWFHLSTWGSAWRQKVLYCRSWLFHKVTVGSATSKTHYLDEQLHF